VTNNASELAGFALPAPDIPGQEPLDEAVIRFYRTLINEGFRFAGTIENATIVLDPASENVRICDHVGTDSLTLYFVLNMDRIEKVRYLCMCDPTTNAVVEIFCDMAEGSTLEEALRITPRAFYLILGARSQELERKAEGLLELFSKGIGGTRH
jgi:hypothetical protein